MRDALAVMAGGAVGSLSRWLVSGFIASFPWAASFPCGTLIVNISGSFAIGVLAGILGDSGVLDAPQGVRSLLIVGFLGGFTTFSAFSIQTLDLARSSAWGSACMNIILHVSLGLFAVWLGSATAQWLNGQTFK